MSDACPIINSFVQILLVDDEVRNLDVLESLLQAPEYRLVRAQTAEQALLYLLEGEFAVIVLDVNLPGMNGIELANLIKQRKRTQHIPIIFLTAYFQDEDDMLEGYGTGAVDYLTKPFNPKILKSKIGVFVDLFHKSRALAVTNTALELQISQREKAENALRLINNDLEARVQERTADLNRLNKELRASEAEAMAASRAKDDFLAALSHELRTPLNPVLLLATEAAANSRLAPEVQADFAAIAKNITLEARLIDDLLDLSRIAHGKFTLDMRPMDVHQCLHEALAMIGEEISQKQIDLILKLEARQHVVHGDDVRIKQVFWNVLKNAVKFTSTGGSVIVESCVKGDGGDLLIHIHDTGIGMKAVEIERVFEAFSQGEHMRMSGSHSFGGLGLGLAISRMMVNLHAGSITASSNGRNQGTTLSITLPLYRAQAEIAPPEERPPARPMDPEGAIDRPLRILLVEDHPSTAHALSQLLIRRKHAIAVASSIAQARVLAGRQQFDLLISDIGLPDGNGYELMEELRHMDKLVGIALTGYGMEEDINRSRLAGFLMQLTKPISVQALDSALAMAMRERKQGAAGDSPRAS